MDTVAAEKTDLRILREALLENDLEGLRQQLAEMAPGEIVLALESLPADEREVVWDLVDPDDGGEILAELADEVRTGLIEGMEPDELVAAAEGLEFDDLADIAEDLPQDVLTEIVASLSAQDRARLESALSFEEDTAGGLMNPDVVSVRPDVSLEVVVRYLRMLGELPDDTYSIYVVDSDNRLAGSLDLSRLITGDPETLVGDRMNEDVEAIPATTSEKEVATTFQTNDLVVAPVVDEDGALLGQIVVDDVVDVIQDIADHDILGLAGLDEEDDMFAPVVSSAQRRAIWLGVNLATAFLASGVVAMFQPALEQIVILAVLMPVVASMGGIAGSQTLTIVIRGLALGRIEDSNVRWLMAKELAVGVLNGLIWAVVVAVVAVLLFRGSLGVGAVIAAALAINLLAAAFAGMTIPLILRKLNIDPALAGGVILTTVTDVIGFVAFLGLGTWFLL